MWPVCRQRNLLVSRKVRSGSEKVYLTVYIQHGKWVGQSLMAADDTVPTISRRIYTTDRSTKAQFPVDTGSDSCVLPRALVREPRVKSLYELSAANGTPMATYGTASMTLNFRLRPNFTWRFVVTDVTKPIIGVDFLARYDFLIDVRNRKLIDATTRLSASGKAVTEKTSNVKIVTGSTHFYELLTSFPKVTRPDGTATVKHKTVHFIKTTPGRLVAHKPRCLAPDKLQAAKKVFDAMLKLGIARPSKSCWSSPLHMVPKQGNEWTIEDSTRERNLTTTQFAISMTFHSLWLARKYTPQLIS